jgi:non-homologous end joining protein Ku
VLQVVESKVEGRAVTSMAPQAQRTQVIDLMQALKQSLGQRGSGARAEGNGPSDSGSGKAALEKKPATKARREKVEAAPKEKKVQGGRR